MGKPRSSDATADILQGTLDLLILRVLKTSDLHGWGIADRIQAHSQHVLSVGEGSLYPALYRLEDRGWVLSSWGISENNRRAKFYRLTREGRRQLSIEEDAWHRVSTAISGVLRHA
jgi:transcriptional regulator